MLNKDVITFLRKSRLIASCSACGEEFSFSKVLMFDGLGKFPADAESKRQALLDELKSRVDQLEKRKLSVASGEKTTVAVGIGKIVEKILPICGNFTLPLSDCRPLFEPIDLIVFNGASKNFVDSITFMEIKTGSAKLNAHQKAIKEKVENGGVSFKEI